MTASSAGGLTTDVSARTVDRARPSSLAIVAAAWADSSLAVRAGAVVTVLVAIGLSVVGRVPLGSGLGVASLVPAALVDVYERRLPNRLVAAAAIVLGAGTLVAAAVDGPPPIGTMVLGAAAMAGPMFVLHLASPSSMGFGDVKAGLVLGAALGAIEWQLALAGLALAAGSSAVVALARDRREIPFGPGLVFGTLLALAAHPTFTTST